MNIIFVHGMGRSSLSWLPTVKRFRKQGYKTFTFDYFVSLQDFSSIVNRLERFLVNVAKQGEYIVVGHSLGGVLLRAALENIGGNTRLPKMMFLLGSPVLPSRIANKLRNNPVFRFVTRDCGQLLSSSTRMDGIAKAKVPTIAVIGNKGLNGRLSPFGSELNDGIVSVSETSADWFKEEIHVPVVHTLLPSSNKVCNELFKWIEKS